MFLFTLALYYLMASALSLSWHDHRVILILGGASFLCFLIVAMLVERLSWKLLCSACGWVGYSPEN